MLVKPVQPEKAELPMLVTFGGRATVVSPVQPKNAWLPIVTRLFGRLIVDKCVAFWNTYAGSAVTPSGTVIVLRFVQPEKLPLLALVSPLG